MRICTDQKSHHSDAFSTDSRKEASQDPDAATIARDDSHAITGRYRSTRKRDTRQSTTGWFLEWK
jgi:hypothetical protein